MNTLLRELCSGRRTAGFSKSSPWRVKALDLELREIVVRVGKGARIDGLRSRQNESVQGRLSADISRRFEFIHRDRRLGICRETALFFTAPRSLQEVPKRTPSGDGGLAWSRRSNRYRTTGCVPCRRVTIHTERGGQRAFSAPSILRGSTKRATWPFNFRGILSRTQTWRRGGVR